MKQRRSFSYAKYGYLFSIPFIVVFILFNLYPTLYTALLGFTDCKGLGNTNWHFLKEDIFKNFKLILNNQSFKTAVTNTFKIWIMNFIPQITLALLLTAWFTSRRNVLKGQGFFKVVFYMPNIITAASVAILFNALFGYPMGPANDLLVSIGAIETPFNFTVSKTAAQLIVAFIQFWMWYGYTMIILISGVLGINPEIYEAAEIDGANDVQMFFRITIPNLRTILIYTLITALIGGLTMYDIPKLYSNGQPDNAVLTANMFVYNQAFSGSYMYNRASAASMLMFVVIAICSVVVFFLMRDKKA
ncbi:MAG: sugar ABC transporter permease [Oscillospiraceae bacterium]|nr:sugar ABC transporter permease [Oscillospiraceae bacterium]